MKPLAVGICFSVLLCAPFGCDFGGQPAGKSPHLIEFTDANFKAQVLESDRPVLVDFWAPWCGPCRQMSPTINELADQYQGKARIGQLNVDEATETARRYDINSIPALIVFRNGKEVARLIGVQPKSLVQEALEQAR